MDNKLQGSIGTSASLALRLGQAIFSAASLLFMCLNVSYYSYSYPPFCFLVATMSFVTPWNLGLAVIDAFSLLVKRSSHQPGILPFLIGVDWVLSFLSLATACSTASATDYLIASGGSPYCNGNMCRRYQLSAAMAFLSWILSLASFLFNLWLLLPTVYLLHL
ncbi:PREDICTED: CASP-like protein ARALYDRAFT_485429 [Nicotiana attenuata]|uniref:CASP-like protein n=1 Tax=Nicotiana attenuata TaxID=49451 RepID=A0A1J6KA78_NICAT|nr:PREDICTED: CASP-like protein ARALYDRAFT_485429 [Nicotiana attenuata]OIT26278.1 casp-like protein 5c1 [Nicotiana attenuata]